MEFLVCMLLASIFTGGRVAQDVIATLTGNTPPHVERARLRAERDRVKAERDRLKVDQQSARYTQGKPRLKDVAAVYWGDALSDVIAAHERRRGEKRDQRQENTAAKTEDRPARQVRPSLKERAQRFGRLLWEPVGEKRPEDSGPTQAPPANEPGNTASADQVPGTNDVRRRRAAAAVTELGEVRRNRPMPRATCPRCGNPATIVPSGWCEPCTLRAPQGFCPKCEGVLRLADGEWVHGAHWPCAHSESADGHTTACAGGCGKQLPMHPSMVGTMTVWCPGCRNKPAQLNQVAGHPRGDGITSCPRCAAPVFDTGKYGRYCLACDTVRTYKDSRRGPYECEACQQACYAADVKPLTDLNPNRVLVPVLVHQQTGSPRCPTPEQIQQAEQAKSAIKAGTRAPREGDTMTTTSNPSSTAGAPTGEAVNYETAMAELDKLEAAQRAHLEQAQAALDKAGEMKAGVAETQATYRPSAEAAGMVHQSLSALNLDQETVAATGTVADAMPPNEVDAMFEQIEAMEARIRQQVANAEAALAATAAARASLVEKYGDASTTVQQHLAGDSRFLANTSA